MPASIEPSEPSRAPRPWPRRAPEHRPVARGAFSWPRVQPGKAGPRAAAPQEVAGARGPVIPGGPRSAAVAVVGPATASTPRTARLCAAPMRRSPAARRAGGPPRPSPSLPPSRLRPFQAQRRTARTAPRTETPRAISTRMSGEQRVARQRAQREIDLDARAVASDPLECEVPFDRMHVLERERRDAPEGDGGPRLARAPLRLPRPPPGRGPGGSPGPAPPLDAEWKSWRGAPRPLQSAPWPPSGRSNGWRRSEADRAAANPGEANPGESGGAAAAYST